MRNLIWIGRLTWLVYIIGAAIGGRVSFTSSDEYDAMDGELVCRLYTIMFILLKTTMLDDVIMFLQFHLCSLTLE